MNAFSFCRTRSRESPTRAARYRAVPRFSRNAIRAATFRALHDALVYRTRAPYDLAFTGEIGENF